LAPLFVGRPACKCPSCGRPQSPGPSGDGSPAPAHLRKERRPCWPVETPAGRFAPVGPGLAGIPLQSPRSTPKAGRQKTKTGIEAARDAGGRPPGAPVPLNRRPAARVPRNEFFPQAQTPDNLPRNAIPRFKDRANLPVPPAFGAGSRTPPKCPGDPNLPWIGPPDIPAPPFFGPEVPQMFFFRRPLRKGETNFRPGLRPPGTRA